PAGGSFGAQRPRRCANVNRAGIVHRHTLIAVPHYLNAVPFLQALDRDALLLALHICLGIEAEAIDLVATVGAQAELPRGPRVIALDQHAADHAEEGWLLPVQNHARA